MALPESMQWTKLIARFPGDICTTHVASVPRIKRKVKSKWAWSTFPYSSWSLWVGESSLWLLKLKKCEINVPNFRCLENKRKIMQFLWISCSNQKKKRKYGFTRTQPLIFLWPWYSTINVSSSCQFHVAADILRSCCGWCTTLHLHQCSALGALYSGHKN